MPSVWHTVSTFTNYSCVEINNAIVNDSCYLSNVILFNHHALVPISENKWSRFPSAA